MSVAACTEITYFAGGTSSLIGTMDFASFVGIFETDTTKPMIGGIFYDGSCWRCRCCCCCHFGGVGGGVGPRIVNYHGCVTHVGRPTPIFGIARCLGKAFDAIICVVSLAFVIPSRTTILTHLAVDAWLVVRFAAEILVLGTVVPCYHVALCCCHRSHRGHHYHHQHYWGFWIMMERSLIWRQK